MKATLIWQCAITAAALIGTAALASAAEPQKEDAAFSAKLFTSIENSDYDAFVADGTSAFKGITKEQFEAVCVQLAPKLKAGHTVSFLGELKQHGFRVTIWKVSFIDGSDDALATLSVKDGKVGGFWIK
jgi:hypothetical protein